MKKACSFRNLPSGGDRVTVRRERHSRSGFLKAESAPGLFKGQCRSRGGSEKGSWSVGLLPRVPTSEESRLMTRGHSKKLELASAAAARTLTRSTSAGRAGAFGCWSNPTAHGLGAFRGAGNAGTQKWFFA